MWYNQKLQTVSKQTLWFLSSVQHHTWISPFVFGRYPLSLRLICTFSFMTVTHRQWPLTFTFKHSFPALLTQLQPTVTVVQCVAHDARCSFTGLVNRISPLQINSVVCFDEPHVCLVTLLFDNKYKNHILKIQRRAWVANNAMSKKLVCFFSTYEWVFPLNIQLVKLTMSFHKMIMLFTSLKNSLLLTSVLFKSWVSLTSSS